MFPALRYRPRSGVPGLENQIQARLLANEAGMFQKAKEFLKYIGRRGSDRTVPLRFAHFQAQWRVEGSWNLRSERHEMGRRGRGQ